ncbi:MAG: hypothetical protein KR126chlam3_01708 [Chlamydiae bacterium]|nr:hypothetical protein [Chlamydiota bacterium]
MEAFVTIFFISIVIDEIFFGRKELRKMQNSEEDCVRNGYQKKSSPDGSPASVIFVQ